MKFIEIPVIIPLRFSEDKLETVMSINVENILTITNTKGHDDTPTTCYITVGTENYAIYTTWSYEETMENLAKFN